VNIIKLKNFMGSGTDERAFVQKNLSIFAYDEEVRDYERAGGFADAGNFEKTEQVNVFQCR
jgi:hypothetical protein